MSERVGSIVRLQVQAEPLTPSGVYEWQHLVPVDRAVVSADGMLGWDGTGWVVDAHHVAHPRPRGGGKRALSIGLTGHYAAMAERFAPAVVGIGGENIVVDGPALRLPAIAEGFLIRRPDGQEIELLAPRVASPCLEFTSFLLGSEALLARAEVKDELAFLDGGTRGHIVDVGHLIKPVPVEIGDEVFLR
jgi:MOSC domain-containing protein YiiM